MKIVKEYINEKFSEDGDPIKDMDIGAKHLIHQWFKTWAPEAKYTIDNDLNIKVNGSLDLSEKLVTKLPDNLYVEGFLDLRRSAILELPHNLKVIGPLDLLGTRIKELPEDIILKGDVDLSRSSILKLPDNLYIGGYLDLYETNINVLPKNLYVEGFLDITKTRISSLPDSLIVKGEIIKSFIVKSEFMYEAFKENSDPIEDMAIGVIETTNNIIFLKRTPLDKLEKIYKRYISGVENSNIIVDNVMLKDFTYANKIRFFNKLVTAIRYNRDINTRNNVRNQGFKPGDAIKITYKGNEIIGYIIFSKRGLPLTDARGRVRIVTPDSQFAVPLHMAKKLTPDEQKEFDKIYGSLFGDYLRRDVITRMNKVKFSNPKKYEKLKKEYSKIMFKYYGTIV